MSDYAKKLKAFQDKRQQLTIAYNKLIEKRKKEIADLAEKFNLLTIDDKTLSKCFANLQELPHESPPKNSHTSRVDSSHKPEIREA